MECLELFSRKPYNEDFDVWGNEVPDHFWGSYEAQVSKSCILRLRGHVVTGRGAPLQGDTKII